MHKTTFPIVLLFATCICLLLPGFLRAEEKETHFRITVLKTSGEPQAGIILKINGKPGKQQADANGVISFSISMSSKREASLYFPDNERTPAHTFTLEEKDTEKTILLDSPSDVALHKQQNTTFAIEGIVCDTQGNPIPGAAVHLQGTERRTLTDEIGLFSLEADYNHLILIRALGMDNLSIGIEPFLKHPEEPLRITLRRKNPDRVYNTVEQMPEYPGGMKAFMNYLKRNLHYPPQAKKDSIEGVVAVRFIVEKDGSISSPSIARGLEASMDTAALQAIRGMPRWIPAREAGIAVRCRYSVPVQFKIERPKPKPQPLPVRDTLATTLPPADSLRTDSLMQILRPRMRPDSLHVDSLFTDSLRMKRRLFHAPDTLKADSLQTDSLTVPKLLQLPTDSLRTDSVMQATPDGQNAAPVKKKRNIFARFFRWLFGIKN